MDQETINKWRLILGKFSEEQLPLAEKYQDMDAALDFLYSREYTEDQGVREEDSNSDIQGGRGASTLSIPSWIEKVRKLFPEKTVEILQRQAIDKYELKELLTDEKILKQMQPDMELLKNILCFKNIMSPQVLQIARSIIKQVVNEIREMLETKVTEAFFGKKNPYQSSTLKSMRNLDFKKTVRRNLKNYDIEKKILVPDRVYFCSRIKKNNEYHIVLVVDESGSMLESVIYSAVMAGIFSNLSSFRTDLIIFDTNIVDLTDYISDPVEVLMNVQLGGGTDISKALDYASTKIIQPSKTIVVLVSDLYDGYDYRQMYKRVHDIIESGARMFILPALNDFTYYQNSYDKNAAQSMENLGANVAAITPEELAQWIAKVIL